MKNLSERVAQLAGRVDSFMKQRTIVAVLMLYEGVMLLVQTENPTRDMATGIAIAIALAAGSVIVEALAKRGEKKKAVIPALLAVGLAVYIFFQPDFFAGILRYLVAASVLITGLLNLAQAFGISKIRMHGDETAVSETQGKEDSMAGTVWKTVNSEINRKIEPTRLFLSRIGKSNVSIWITGILMTALGIFLFFRSVEGNLLLARVSGIIMIMTSIADLVAAYKMKKTLKAEETCHTQQ